MAHEQVKATCTTAGTKAYWECTACGSLFSDENGQNEITQPVEIAKAAHTLTAVAKEDATCKATGTEAYWSCTVCGKLFSDANATTEISQPVEIAKKAHTPMATAQKENEDPATCLAGGSYDSVIYCSECGAEISRTKVETGKTDIHTPGAAGKENEVAATCVAGGSYESVVYCEVCGLELSRTTVTTEKDENNHKWVEVEPGMPATRCDQPGIEPLLRCELCDEETGGEMITIPHDYDENGVCKTCGSKKEPEILGGED